MFEKKEKIIIKNLFKVFEVNPEKAMKLLQKGVSKSEIFDLTGQIVGIFDARFTVYEGENVCRYRVSGSGKSTLMRQLNRLIEPTSGQIYSMG